MFCTSIIDLELYVDCDTGMHNIIHSLIPEVFDDDVDVSNNKTHNSIINFEIR